MVAGCREAVVSGAVYVVKLVTARGVEASVVFAKICGRFFDVFDLVFVVGVAAGLALVGVGAWRRAVYVYRLRGRFRRFCGCFLTQFLRGLV